MDPHTLVVFDHLTLIFGPSLARSDTLTQILVGADHMHSQCVRCLCLFRDVQITFMLYTSVSEHFGILHIIKCTLCVHVISTPQRFGCAHVVQNLQTLEILYFTGHCMGNLGTDRDNLQNLNNSSSF